jgi:hypothetical protein
MISRQELDENLSELRRRDPQLKQFGASTHRYKLNPPAQIVEIEQFESDAGVKLPLEYLNFLTRCGNGGAGPHYGLLSLEQVRSEFDDEFPLKLAGNHFSAPLSPHEERCYPVQGAIPIAHGGCGNMALIVTTGPDRGNIWFYSVDERLLPFSHEMPVYRLNSTIEETLAANSLRNGRLLADQSTRWQFVRWYEDWLTRCLQEVRDPAIR